MKSATCSIDDSNFNDSLGISENQKIDEFMIELTRSQPKSIGKLEILSSFHLAGPYYKKDENFNFFK